MTDTFIEHCTKLYQALDERATTKILGDGREVKVFAGNYGEVWRSTNISQTYYSAVRKNLVNHSSIEILQKGSRNTESVIALFGLPEVWQPSGWLGDDPDLTGRVTYARLAAEVNELKKSTGGINVLMALQEYESRLVALESKMEQIIQMNNLQIEN